MHTNTHSYWFRLYTQWAPAYQTHTHTHSAQREKIYNNISTHPEGRLAHGRPVLPAIVLPCVIILCALRQNAHTKAAVQVHRTWCTVHRHTSTRTNVGKNRAQRAVIFGIQLARAQTSLAYNVSRWRGGRVRTRREKYPPIICVHIDLYLFVCVCVCIRHTTGRTSSPTHHSLNENV